MIDRWIREVEVKTKSGSSGWAGGLRFPLGSGGAGRPTWQLGSWAAGQHGRQRVQHCSEIFGFSFRGEAG